MWLWLKLQYQAHRMRNGEIQPDADQDSGAMGAGHRVWGYVVFFGWDFKRKIFGKIKHIYPYI